MDFEKAYDNYKNGIASEEEKVFVEGEIEKVRKLTQLIDAQDAEKCHISEAADDTIVKAKKRYTVKSALRMTAISLVTIVVLAGVICAAVFGTAASSAKRNVKYSMTEAEIIAKQYVASQSEATADKLITTEKERDYKIESTLTASYYYYSFEFKNGEIGEIDVYVNAKTGAVSFIDYD